MYTENATGPNCLSQSGSEPAQESTDRVTYKYPAQLLPGDVLITRSGDREMVKDISIYRQFPGEYVRCNWVQVDGSIYSPRVMTMKYICNQIKQVKVCESVVLH